MAKNKLLSSSEKLLFKTSDEANSQLENLYDSIIEQISEMQSINTDKVEPLVRINNQPTTFLREDVEGEVLSREDIMSNASSNDGTYITIPKGGSND